MTDQEREIILKMIEEGKITPEEGLELMQALVPPADDPGKGSSLKFETTPGAGWGKTPASNLANDPRIARVKSIARSLWQVPIWIGAAIVVLCALGMYYIQLGSGTNFWFFFLILPLLLGILLMAIGAGTRNAHWIFVKVNSHKGEGPRRILLGFPLPIKLTAWVLKTFSPRMKGLRDTSVDEIIQVLETGISDDEPLIVNVDEGEEGELVQVYIG